MEYSELQETYGGFATPQFNANFKIPAKVQPPPPGTEIYNSPMFAQDPQVAWNVAYGPPPPEPQQTLTKPPVKRKSSDYLLPSKDSELPPELTKQFQALHCLLCDAKMNSPIPAKMHYDSKQHDKKVNMWLAEWAKKTGVPMPKRQRKAQTPNVEGPKGPNAFFCEHCQVSLTSIQHANQHYMGKKHRLVAQGKSCPKGSGFYNAEGKWVKQNKPTHDQSGRFGIGTSFVPQPEPTTLEPPPPPPPPEETPAETPKETPSAEPAARFCTVCNIYVTSTAQMETHLSGSKHVKNCKKLGVSVPPPTPLHDSDTVLDSYGSNAPKYTTQDFSIYRTPSGQFYCNVCNLTAPNEGIFSTHISSKKHLKMAKEKR